eukprot:jgi/Mesen1/7174/ME000037S06539
MPAPPGSSAASSLNASPQRKPSPPNSGGQLSRSSSSRHGGGGGSWLGRQHGGAAAEAGGGEAQAQGRAGASASGGNVFALAKMGGLIGIGRKSGNGGGGSGGGCKSMSMGGSFSGPVMLAAAAGGGMPPGEGLGDPSSLDLIIVDTSMLPQLVEAALSEPVSILEPFSPMRASALEPQLAPLRELLGLLRRLGDLGVGRPGLGPAVIWLVAANTPASVREALKQAGCVAIVSKPLHPSRMERMLSMAMEIRYGAGLESSPGGGGGRSHALAQAQGAGAGASCEAAVAPPAQPQVAVGGKPEGGSHASLAYHRGKSMSWSPSPPPEGVPPGSTPEGGEPGGASWAQRACHQPGGGDAAGAAGGGAEGMADSWKAGTSTGGAGAGGGGGCAANGWAKKKGEDTHSRRSSSDSVAEGGGGGGNLPPETTAAATAMAGADGGQAGTLPPGPAPNRKLMLGSPSALKGLTILLAEDTLMLQRVAMLTLKKLGAAVVAVENGQMALDLLMQSHEHARAASAGAAGAEQQRPHRLDLVLMDCQMPVLDGYAATQEIRRREAQFGVRTPVIALTAHAMSGDEHKCLAAGMDGYLTKPIDSKALVQKVLALVQLPNERGEEGEGELRAAAA